MAVAASGSQVKAYYAVEDASGVLQPNETTPAFIPIRFNTLDPTRDTTQVDSNEINNSRQRVKSRQGTFSVAGSIAAELTFGSHDALMEAVLQSTFVTQPTYTASTIAAVAVTNEFTDSASQFVIEGFHVGALVTVTGFTGGYIAGGVDLKVTALSAGSMIIGGTDGDSIIDDAVGEPVTIALAGDYLDVGETVPRIALLIRSTDVSIDKLYRGVRVAD